ncbi:hypothetical protein B9Q11_00740 [Candidatus Marsarchaeota G2 archaeon ECH_B_SAG-F08]|uniref:Uncharacterized protein n=1 Tax=Candidatus Marsarchaeota G2 archaeon ECH_B_SAG-F08 TaxID=1978165 RepID=A0A2R6BLN8_9ARCH|nr:MAG: hypothetical protein B9Q11_00740 [Candidatus Marsarchaeota G2 archaeon ECH_B_SAG-F08]
MPLFKLARDKPREERCSALIEYDVPSKNHGIHRCGREFNHPGVHVCETEGCAFVWGFLSLDSQSAESLGLKREEKAYQKVQGASLNAFNQTESR